MGVGVATGAVTAAAYTAVIGKAIKASGAIVRVEPNDFLEILHRQESPLVVFSEARTLSKNKYITSYKGLYFYTKSPTLLTLPPETEIIQAKKIWIPG